MEQYVDFVVSDEELNQLISKVAYVDADTAIEMIDLAMTEQRMVEIEYTSVVTPRVMTRKIEPYKLCVRNRGDAIYGFDPNDNTIKLFYIQNISEVNVLDEKFSPRWLIENELR